MGVLSLLRPFLPYSPLPLPSPFYPRSSCISLTIASHCSSVFPCVLHCPSPLRTIVSLSPPLTSFLSRQQFGCRRTEPLSHRSLSSLCSLSAPTATALDRSRPLPQRSGLYWTSPSAAAFAEEPLATLCLSPLSLPLLRSLSQPSIRHTEPHCSVVFSQYME